MSHAWMPSSPCGAKCVHGRDNRVRFVTLAARWALVAAVLLVFPLLMAARFLPVRARRAVAASGARALLFAVGIRLDAPSTSTSTSTSTSGTRPTTDGRGTLIVANHVSWTDILVLAALFPARFVARGDILAWPVLGTIARLVRVVPIDRARLRSLPSTVDTVAQLLREGSTVVVFPEGTTWCGTAFGSFRPAMFQAAIDSGAQVLPVAISYVGEGGVPSTATAFVGDESMGSSLDGIIGTRGVSARVDVSEVVPNTDRRTMALASHRAVHRRDHDLLEVAMSRSGYPGRRYGTSTRRVSGPRRHHPDAARSDRGDDGRLLVGR
ncbi:1-acyl-sn-glycerol-3-phosphate acyltransferase [Rhodococcoides trifolii]|uniref:1-acyl-sn-glycerol-3-phosphate acyltransferase n=1 Tax=Rhodococcoides trifolii TaxID=908250 RepID=A0A917D2U4_9NOCA|nr:lysophospholipid acyltransferase family protein [Rhodococcus trifolii]GGG06186.1 1-acyl-sn-glycerol-3-phosphate acyltransferase [Rhodococcus trifolii]